MSAHPFFESAGQGDLLFWGGKKGKNSGNIAVSIRTRKGNLAGRDKHDARLGRVVQGKKRGGGNPLF